MNDQILAVQRMQDYIEEHICENISMADLARSAGYSPWHARRLFLELVSLSPSDYIRKVRLSKAALKLRDEKVMVTDVAFEYGFESVDGFQRAFLDEFGYNPKEYSKTKMPITLFKPYGVKAKYGKRRKESMETTNVFLQVIEKPERKVILKRGIKAKEYWTYCEEVGCDVWRLLLSMKSLCGEPVCLWLPEKYILPGTSEYVQGVEVGMDYDGIVPEGFDVITLPASKYLMFQGEPFAEENFSEAISAIWEAEKKYEPSVIGYHWDENNPRIQLEPIGTRGYIELLPITK